MKGDHVDIWSGKEVVSYLNDLVKKGSVKRCSKLKAELGYLNAYYPKCMDGFASREEARNVKTSSKGDSAPRYYAWPVCPEVCPFFKETADFTSSLFGEKIEKRIPEKEALVVPQKEALAIPEKETLVISEMVEVSMIPRPDEKATLEPGKALKGADEIIQRVDQTMPEVQIKKLKKLSKKTGLPVSEHIRRAIDEYLSKQEMGKK